MLNKMSPVACSKVIDVNDCMGVDEFARESYIGELRECIDIMEVELQQFRSKMSIEAARYAIVANAYFDNNDHATWWQFRTKEQEVSRKYYNPIAHLELQIQYIRESIENIGNEKPYVHPLQVLEEEDENYLVELEMKLH